MGVTAGIFLASILLKEMRYLVYIRYLWHLPSVRCRVSFQLHAIVSDSFQGNAIGFGGTILRYTIKLMACYNRQCLIYIYICFTPPA
jgi:3-dehydroquinate dehydratase